MAKAPHSFDFYTADFLEGVVLFEPDEIGAYCMLLCFQWKHGCIPETDRERMRAASVFDLDQWARIWEKIREKFVMVDYHDIVDHDVASPNRHVFANPRMHRDRNIQLPKYQAAVERAQVNGRKGGRKPKSVPKSVLSGTDLQKREGGSKKREELHTDITFPEPLNTPAVRSAVQMWSVARSKEYGPLDAIGIQVPIQRCLRWAKQYGVEAVVDCILAAAEGEWKNLRPPSGESTRKAAPTKKRKLKAL